MSLTDGNNRSLNFSWSSPNYLFPTYESPINFAQQLTRKPKILMTCAKEKIQLALSSSGTTLKFYFFTTQFPSTKRGKSRCFTGTKAWGKLTPFTDKSNAIPKEKPGVFVKALEDHFEDEGNPWEVTVRKGNDVKVLESGDATWWKVEMKRQGFVPASCLKPVEALDKSNPSRTPDDEGVYKKSSVLDVDNFLESKDKPWEVSVGEGDVVTLLATKNKQWLNVEVKRKGSIPARCVRAIEVSTTSPPSTGVENTLDTSVTEAQVSRGLKNRLPYLFQYFKN